MAEARRTQMLACSKRSPAAHRRGSSLPYTRPEAITPMIGPKHSCAGMSSRARRIRLRLLRGASLQPALASLQSKRKTLIALTPKQGAAAESGSHCGWR